MAVLHSLVPTLLGPPSKQQSGEQSWISWDYYPKVVKTNENARSSSTSLTTVKFVNLHSSIHTFLSGFSATVLGYTVEKTFASPRNLTWFATPFQGMILQSDIGHFPSICGTCPNKKWYVLPSCPNDECAHTHVITAQSLDARLAHGYTASKCLSQYPVMKRSRLYYQMVTWLYRQTVSQSSHVTTWHLRLYYSTHFWYVRASIELSFTFL